MSDVLEFANTVKLMDPSGSSEQDEATLRDLILYNLEISQKAIETRRRGEWLIGPTAWPPGNGPFPDVDCYYWYGLFFEDCG